MIAFNKVLKLALSRKRGHESVGEAEFVAELSMILCELAPLKMVTSEGNLVYRIGTSRTLFCAHTDTVHRRPGVNYFRGETIKNRKWLMADGDVLGADNGAGLAVLAHLMENKVPGTYVFFRGEEVGGEGSRGMAGNLPGFFERHDRAIAFDRRGTDEVITHQGGMRCASEEFASALSMALSTACGNLLYCPSSDGIYTDTAELTHLIPECTNISAGYYDEHTPAERLDMTHLTLLAKQAVKVDWENLPTERVSDYGGEADFGEDWWAKPKSKPNAGNTHS